MKINPLTIQIVQEFGKALTEIDTINTKNILIKIGKAERKFANNINVPSRNKRTIEFSDIANGSIIRLKNDCNRDWVCIHHSNCYPRRNYKFNKHNRNHTGYFLFGALWYRDNGRFDTNQVYGKTLGQLERGMFNNIELVGNIFNKSDRAKYLKNGRL